MAHRDSRPPESEDVQEAAHAPRRARAAGSRPRGGAPGAPRPADPADFPDRDLTRLDGARGLIGSTIRTLLFDTWTEEFLDRHPHGTVVELGAGSGTRFERLDNGTVHWFDVDLPEVRRPARTVSADTDRRRSLAVSATDPGWIDAVRRSPGPYFLVAEAVLIQLERTQVREVFRLAAEGLPGARLALETASGRMAGRPDGHDVLGKVAARMRWGCDDPAEPEGWHDSVSLAQSCTLARLPAAVSSRMPMAQRGMLRAMATVMRRQIQDCRFNLYTIGERDPERMAVAAG
ncbi:class I SAM-dependent methyltransferase [Streptomyces sp. NPDC014894]|uniref:class I SAM-dependent methyltransferase n=1 Tax=Streptomyces sp. NPDC014894 TaxID=3364931 RepID=UPI0036FA239A